MPSGVRAWRSHSTQTEHHASARQSGYASSRQSGQSGCASRASTRAEWAEPGRGRTSSPYRSSPRARTHTHTHGHTHLVTGGNIVQEALDTPRATLRGRQPIQCLLHVCTLADRRVRGGAPCPIVRWEMNESLVIEGQYQHNTWDKPDNTDSVSPSHTDTGNQTRQLGTHLGPPQSRTHPLPQGQSPPAQR